MDDVTTPGRYKIGKTIEPPKRIKAVQNDLNKTVGGKVDYTCIIPTNNVSGLETSLHKKYAAQNLRDFPAGTEWFMLNFGAAGSRLQPIEKQTGHFLSQLNFILDDISTTRKIQQRIKAPAMPNTLITQHNNILRIQLNRPQKKNALTPAMYVALREAIERADNDTSIHVITLSGSGDSFCAGNDLNTFLQDPGSDAAARFIKAIANARAPIVAAVNGVAVGVGVTMLLHCDLVYASEDARFNFAFIDLGLLPEAASSYLLPRMLGYAGAAELLMLGEAFSAEKARECGLVNQVVAADALEELGAIKGGTAGGQTAGSAAADENAAAARDDEGSPGDDGA